MLSKEELYLVKGGGISSTLLNSVARMLESILR